MVPRMPDPTSFTFKLTPDEQSTLIEILRAGNYKPVQVEHTRIAAATEDCRICLYKSAKCVIQGKNAADFVRFVMEPVVLQKAQLGYEKIVNPEAVAPHMGIDESGKGDFFGPLVTAAAYIDPALADRMRDMGVKDSKAISSDAKALAMGRELRRLLGNRFSVVRIGPEAYNKLYTKMRSVNRILGWAHARTIENLLEVVPDCPRAISDQFGPKEQLERSLLRKGRTIQLVQYPKAESDLAVAAASVLAREGFLRALKEMETQYALTLPKGASDAVRAAAVELAKKHGPQVLIKAAKCHFRTADAVLQAAGASRTDLGADGQAVSKTITNPTWRRKKTPADAPPETDTE